MSGTRVAPGETRPVQRGTASLPAQTRVTSMSRRLSNDRSMRPLPSIKAEANKMGGVRAKRTPIAASQDSYQLVSRPPCMCSVCSASLDPPITKETLSELDWDRVSNNLLLRHDLNFEPHIQYRPNTYGVCGQERITQTSLYWDAVKRVIEVYLADREGKCISHAEPCLRNSLPSSKPVRQGCQVSERLPRMFEAVRETLKTLVSEEEHQAIDSRLDVELLMQQMENGACDFVSLGDCLASLLRRYCSPERDQLFDDMTERIRLGVHKADAQLITNGLRCAFSILEIMRLVSLPINLLNLIMIANSFSNGRISPITRSNLSVSSLWIALSPLSNKTFCAV